MSSCVPGAVETSTSATLSGRPCVGFAKCVYLKVTKLLGLMTHEPSAVKIFSRDSSPVPVVGEAFEANSAPVSTRLDSR